MRAPRATGALAVLLALATAACADGRPTDENAVPQTSSSAAPPVTSGLTSPAPPPPSAEPLTTADPPPLTLAFAGDVHFSGRLEPLLADAADPSLVLSALAPQLSQADVTVVNLEAAITGRGVPEPKQFHFRVPVTALDALAGAGVDVVSMANNHGVDYGRQGLDDTLAAIADSPVAVVGIGADAAQAFSPAVVEARGTSVAVLAATQVPDRTAAAWDAADGAGVAVSRDPARLVSAVEASAAVADVVVVYLHWGTEGTGCPDVAQRSITPLLVDAGADVVVGGHAHQLQGMGWYTTEAGSSAYVSYGLGNFVWWRSNDEPSVTTGVLTLALPPPAASGVDPGAVTGASWAPMRIADDGVPVLRTGSNAEADLDGWDAVRDCTDLSATPPG